MYAKLHDSRLIGTCQHSSKEKPGWNRSKSHLSECLQCDILQSKIQIPAFPGNHNDWGKEYLPVRSRLQGEDFRYTAVPPVE